MSFDDGFPVFILSFVLFEQAMAFLEFGPFVDPNITIVAPSHNFWPWIPVMSSQDSQSVKSSTKINDEAGKEYFRIPKHNFWPFIPIEVHSETKKTPPEPFYQLPTHNFWPFIPIFDGNVTKPLPSPKPWPPSARKYNYGEVMYKSIMFFEVQRSGWLPENRIIQWRGHSATNDRGQEGEDLSGGWYDSGDYIKFGLPMAAATTMLLWGLVEFPNAYSSVGLLDDMWDCVRWPLDYFIKAHTKKYEFYAQVGDPYLDHSFWGRPEDMNMERPSYKLTPDSPGSDVVAETAASMAAGYLAFKDIDPPYAKKLLAHAQELFEFAERYRGGYSDSIESAEEFYASGSDEDELAWAAVWLYKATKAKQYLTRARYWAAIMPGCWAQSWADKSCGVPVLLYITTQERKYKSQIQNMLQDWLPGGGVEYTPKGLAFKGAWGTLRYTANMAFISLVAAEHGIEPQAYRVWAISQIHYMLGDAGRSYVIGFGHNPPTRPHHASSSCPPAPEPCDWDDYSKYGPNFHILYGALVGGPGSEDDYIDSRDDYVHNEVGCDYNGGFQSAVAALRHLELQIM